MGWVYSDIRSLDTSTVGIRDHVTQDTARLNPLISIAENYRFLRCVCRYSGTPDRSKHFEKNMIEPPPPASGSFTPIYTPIESKWSQIAVDPTVQHPTDQYELLGILGTAITPPAILAKPAVITLAEAELKTQRTWQKPDLHLLTLKGKRSNIMFSHCDFWSSKGSTKITFKNEKNRSRRITSQLTRLV